MNLADVFISLIVVKATFKISEECAQIQNTIIIFLVHKKILIPIYYYSSIDELPKSWKTRFDIAHEYAYSGAFGTKID